MRLRDATDYLRLRKVATRPGRVVRFRKTHRDGQELTVTFRPGHPLAGHAVTLQGGRSDVNTFRTIWLDDEYRLARLPAGGVGTVLDVGANVGLFAVRAAALARRVVCYEPVPANFARLSANTAALVHVEAVNEAVGGAAGTLPVFAPPKARSNGQFSLYAGVAGGESGGVTEVAAVPVTTLAAVLDRHAVDRCDLLKIDAEGAEYDLLYNAPAGVLARVGRVHLEYHAVPGDPRADARTLAGFLTDRGFAVEVCPKPHGPNYGLLFARRVGWDG